jgi:hypothetical protein
MAHCPYGQGYAKRDAYPDHTDRRYAREAWFARRAADAYGIVLDPHGKIAWGRSDVGGDPIIVVLTERSRRPILGVCARMACLTFSPVRAISTLRRPSTSCTANSASIAWR